MSDMPSLQFDRPDYAAVQHNAAFCVNCRQPIVQSYYEVNGNMICSTCRENLEHGNDGSRAARVLKATAAGIGIGAVGALVWWGVRKLTGYEIGIISIAIGIGVGKAVRWGSRGRGGWAYQLLAIVLTYLAITANYVPDVVQGIMENNAKEEQAASAPATTNATTNATAAKPAVAKASAASSGVHIGTLLLAVAAIFAIAAAAPVMAGFENIIGLLIIAFGLFEAWKINKRVPLKINGPYSVAPAANG